MWPGSRLPCRCVSLAGHRPALHARRDLVAPPLHPVAALRPGRSASGPWTQARAAPRVSVWSGRCGSPALSCQPPHPAPPALQCDRGRVCWPSPRRLPRLRAGGVFPKLRWTQSRSSGLAGAAFALGACASCPFSSFLHTSKVSFYLMCKITWRLETHFDIKFRL